MSNAGGGNESARMKPVGGIADASASLPWDPAPTADSLVKFEPQAEPEDDFGSVEATGETVPDYDLLHERADSVASSGALTLRVRVGNRLAFAGDRTRQSVLTQISVG